LSEKLQTKIGLLELRRARPDEEGVVLGVKQDAARWLENKGIHQWAGILMAQGEDFVHKKVKDHEVYLAFLGKGPVATVTILWEDPVSWGEKGKDSKAGYLHGLAVLRRHGGQGVGKDLLAWAEGVIRAKGRIVRLDCMAENPRINRYYLDLRFEFAGPATLPNGFKINLYEKS